MQRLTAASFVLLAATNALCAPALAGTIATGEAVSIPGPGPAIVLSVEAEPTVDQSAANPPRLVRFARNTRPKRRARTIQAAHGQAVTSGNNSANAPAPLDCSIESHPDCQPKPASPKSHNHIGNYHFLLEIGG